MGNKYEAKAIYDEMIDLGEKDMTTREEVILYWLGHARSYAIE